MLAVKYLAEIKFSEIQLDPPKEFVDSNFIAHIQPHFVTFLFALASIAIFRKLTGI